MKGFGVLDLPTYVGFSAAQVLALDPATPAHWASSFGDELMTAAPRWDRAQISRITLDALYTAGSYRLRASATPFVSAAMLAPAQFTGPSVLGRVVIASHPVSASLAVGRP